MKKILLLALAVTMLGAACNQQPTPQPEQYVDGTISLAGREISMEFADTPARQAKGLGGRPGIEENQGMLFQFDAPFFPVFWMKDMQFAIDIVWLKGNEVVDITAEALAEPGVSDQDLRTYVPKAPADGVLELKSGWASRNGLKIGDKIEVTRVVR